MRTSGGVLLVETGVWILDTLGALERAEDVFVGSGVEAGMGVGVELGRVVKI